MLHAVTLPKSIALHSKLPQFHFVHLSRVGSDIAFIPPAFLWLASQIESEMSTTKAAKVGRCSAVGCRKRKAGDCLDTMHVALDLPQAGRLSIFLKEISIAASP